ncbi:ADP-ribosyltransferase [Streptomyces acidiscabies]|uniref:Pierisin-like domain-containing protein n=1 Tax=Streptomyces acidiscabies TaxID=42234 RepID=A0A0L0KPW1_9ACTN|nr:ADP-ribosyltransferase [Streptomyces acidiscabies]KND39675.1 hypothetical protein IQ63_02595 [Streptomyces acidiscabies]
MITTSVRRRTAAVVLCLTAVFATSAAAPAPTFAAAPKCPQFEDKLKAAADKNVHLDRITPDPVWRTTCGTLYRSDSRTPDKIFPFGFFAKDVENGQYDIEKYVLVNQPSPYVSTSYDHDLYKTWYKSGWNYYIDAPGGIDVNKTIGDTHKWADQVEVAFPGGIAREYILGVCPVDKVKKIEIMDDCESNPYFVPWH